MHVVHVMNALNVNIGTIGHEHCCSAVDALTFPMLNTNIFDNKTKQSLGNVFKF